MIVHPSHAFSTQTFLTVNMWNCDVFFTNNSPLSNLLPFTSGCLDQNRRTSSHRTLSMWMEKRGTGVGLRFLLLRSVDSPRLLSLFLQSNLWS